MNIALNVRPRLAPGCRLREVEGQPPVLLIPEGVLRLKGVSVQILRLCDGNRTFSELIDELNVIFPAAEERIESETRMFLARLLDRKFLQLMP